VGGEHMVIRLISRFSSRVATIGVVGIGYVGLPLLLHISRSGYRVIGLDTNEERVTLLKAHASPFSHISSDEISESFYNVLGVSSDYSLVKECDALIVCTPTPLDEAGSPDLSYLLNAIDMIISNMRSGQLISVESTVFPGVVNEIIRPKIEASGFRLGQEAFLVYSPERVDPGNRYYKIENTNKIVSGVTESCLELGGALYEGLGIPIVPVRSTYVAEYAKILENVYRAVNIALVNEFKTVAQVHGVDIYEVIAAASTKPFGFSAHYPGPGVGGHCLPVDPVYLAWMARKAGAVAKLTEVAISINSNMPKYIVEKVVSVLSNARGRVYGSKVLLLGVSYKKNVGDIRECPSFEIIRLLARQGCAIFYSDEFVPNLTVGDVGLVLSSSSLDVEILKRVDVAVLITDHDYFDYDLILNNSLILIDARGRYESSRPNVIRA